MPKSFVTERVLVNRINCRLKADGEQLRRCSANSRYYNDLGNYYIVDTGMNTVTAWHIDTLEGLAKDLNALRPGEQLADE